MSADSAEDGDAILGLLRLKRGVSNLPTPSLVLKDTDNPPCLIQERLLNEHQLMVSIKQQEHNVLILNPGKGKNRHQKINQPFLNFLKEHPNFLLQYVIPHNNYRPGKRLLLRETARSILTDWVHLRSTTSHILVYTPTLDLFKVKYKIQGGVPHDASGAQMGNMDAIVSDIHLFTRRFSSKFCQKALDCKVEFTYGRKPLSHTAHFQIRRLTISDQKAIGNLKRNGQYDKLRAGAALLSSPPRTTDGLTRSPSLLLDTGRKRIQTTMLQFSPSRPGMPSQKHKFFCQYMKLREVHERLITVIQLTPPRSLWEEVFTAKCGAVQPCWSCRNCRKRFSQVVIVVVAAQGTKDTLCLPHFGAVFRHPRYSLFSIEEWASISLEELTMVYSQASKQGISAMYVLAMMMDLSGKDVLPKTVTDITCYKGFGKKSACLLLNAMDPNLVVGIPVDRHLASGFRSLGWVDHRLKDETIISQNVETWMPSANWAECNVVCAGLRQVWQNSMYRGVLIAAAKALGPEHEELLHLCCA
jgi:endonuclease III